MSARRILLAALLALCAAPAGAHPLAPALLQLEETAPDRFDVTWRTPVSRVRGADVLPQLPSACLQAGERRSVIEDNEALVERWVLQCEGGLAGQRIAVKGLAASGINVILRIESRGRISSTLLDADQPSFVVAGPVGTAATFCEYFALGVSHLLSGFDHLLFLLGLVLLVRALRPLVLTVTAFTAGHSVTLVLATLGFVRINPALTEFGIALSILAVACVLAAPQETRPVLSRRPWTMAGAFGLLHGLGFAGALSGAGLPAGEVPLALLAFNLGIEAGQVLLIGGALGAAAVWRRFGFVLVRSWQVWARHVPVYAMGGIAASWCFERLITAVQGEF